MPAAHEDDALLTRLALGRGCVPALQTMYGGLRERHPPNKRGSMPPEIEQLLYGGGSPRAHGTGSLPGRLSAAPLKPPSAVEAGLQHIDRGAGG